MAGRYAVLPGKRELTGIDPAMTRRITRQLKEMCIKYPVTAGRMVHVSTKNVEGSLNLRTGLTNGPDDWTDTIASCTTYTEIDNKTGRTKLTHFAIGFNPLYFKNEDVATERYRNMYGNPSGANTPEGTIIHEFGHAVHLCIRETTPGLDNELIRLSAVEDFNHNPLCVGLSTLEMRENALSIDERRREYYAREVFAHAFSAIYLGSPRAQNHPVTEFVRKVIELHRGEL